MKFFSAILMAEKKDFPFKAFIRFKVKNVTVLVFSAICLPNRPPVNASVNIQ